MKLPFVSLKKYENDRGQTITFVASVTSHVIYLWKLRRLVARLKTNRTVSLNES